MLTTLNFGETNGLSNAINFSGETFYFKGLAELHQKFHIVAIVFNVGQASVTL